MNVPLGFLCPWLGLSLYVVLGMSLRLDNSSFRNIVQVTCSAQLSATVSPDSSERHVEHPVPAFERASLPRTYAFQHPYPVDHDS